MWNLSILCAFFIIQFRHGSPFILKNVAIPCSHQSLTMTAPATASNVTDSWIRDDLFGQTLVKDTLKSMESDEDFQRTQTKLSKIGPAAMAREERIRRRRALDDLGVPDFLSFLNDRTASVTTISTTEGDDAGDPTYLHRREPVVLQVNIGLYCNQACSHCHVESSPLRVDEQMHSDTVARILEVLAKSPSIKTLDITGGAPELNRNFRMLVAMARLLRPDLEIIDRCNLTVLQEPGQGLELIEFLASHGVRVVASLPCYSTENVDKQRGNGVFERSIAALLALNRAGYGVEDPNGPGLKLDLVYNPSGAFLPPDQGSLQAAYKEELLSNFGIHFNELFTMTNMPIKRFADYLYRKNELLQYMDLLVQSFNPDTTGSLMCLDTVSVGWDGKVYDCDFNQQLGHGIVGDGETHEGGKSIFDIDSFQELIQDPIRNDSHCFGCTAGMGSS